MTPLDRDRPSWRTVYKTAQDIVTDLDEADLLGCLEEDGAARWKLVETLLEKLSGKPLPLQDRPDLDSEWRNVTLTIEDGEKSGVLRLQNGDLADEVDTPSGVLELEGDHGLIAEFGTYYRLLPRVVAAMDAEYDSEDWDLQETPDDAAGEARYATERDAGADNKTEPPGFVDGMRCLWKGAAVTVRTREGTGDHGIAATKEPPRSMQHHELYRKYAGMSVVLITGMISQQVRHRHVLHHRHRHRHSNH